MADLGQKHECPKCGLKFYDLGKADATCPRCVVEEEAAAQDKKDKDKADDSEE